jgi:hypothetical protein
MEGSETGNRRIFHRRENKPVMLYANTIRNIFKKPTAVGFITT